MKLSSKNVLVTGGAGFVGSALVRELLNEDSNVIVFDDFSSGDVSNLEEIKGSIKIIKGDVLDPKLKEVLKENEVEYVFHLAAEPYIPYCYERPRRFFEVNAFGTLNVLMACKEAGIKKIVQYSTSEVYGGARYFPIDEDHPTNPLSTYAVSKLAADRLSYTFFHEHHIPIVILRQFNAYGPRETQPYVIPEIILQLSKSNKLRLGNIKARRDFTYVDDAARGAVSVMTCNQTEGQTFNLGSGTDHSIESIAYLIADLMGHSDIIINVEDHRLRPLDVERLQCDYSKIQEYTGYKPTVALEEGLKRTIDWFNQNGKKWVWETKIAPEEKLWRG